MCVLGLEEPRHARVGLWGGGMLVARGGDTVLLVVVLGGRPCEDDGNLKWGAEEGVLELCSASRPPWHCRRIPAAISPQT